MKNSRHPGPVPGSTQPPSAEMQPLVLPLPPGGPRHKAGVTVVFGIGLPPYPRGWPTCRRKRYQPVMTLSSIESAAVERVGGAPIFAQTEAWVAINSGTRNLAGLAAVADSLADAFSAL